jgi:tripartite-type tricarboxylate transporter receptor subunit TctC
MKLSRRRAFGVAAAFVAAPSVARLGWAQVYPSRPVRVIVPVAVGGANDTTARLFAQKLSDSLGQQFYVENLPGAGGNLGIHRRSGAGGRLYVACRGRQLRDQSEPLCQNSLQSP